MPDVLDAKSEPVPARWSRRPFMPSPSPWDSSTKSASVQNESYAQRLWREAVGHVRAEALKLKTLELDFRARLKQAWRVCHSPAAPAPSAGAASPRSLANTPRPAGGPMHTEEFLIVMEHLTRMESTLQKVLERQTVKDFYSTAEIAALLGKAEFTVREWCRQDRIQAKKQGSGRGKFQAWVISHEELQRIQKEGLLPVRRP